MKKLPLLLLALAAGCAGPSAMDKVALGVGPRPGTATVAERKETWTGSLAVTADGQETRQNVSKEDRRVFEDEVLEAEGGHVTKLRRKVTEWTLRRQGPGDAAPVAVPRKLAGKTIVLRRTELGTEHDGAEGIPADELRAHPIDALDAILSLPARPVAPGETWEIDGDRIVEVLGGEGESGLKVREARGTGRFERLDGGLAVVSVKIEAAGAFRQLLDVDVALAVAGSFRLEPGTGRLHDFRATGEGKVSGEVDRKGKPAVYSGSFLFTAEGSNRPR
jgi:hypothetical protein